MPKITLTRQVTDNHQRILAPGTHTVSASEAVYYRQMGWTDKPPVSEDPAPPPPEPVPVVAVPEAWEGLHKLERIRIAKDLTGTKGTMSIEAADEVIRAEIMRRRGEQ